MRPALARGTGSAPLLKEAGTAQRIGERRANLERNADQQYRVFAAVVIVGGALVASAATPSLIATIPLIPLAFWLIAALCVIAEIRPLAAPHPLTAAAFCPSGCVSFAVLLLWGLGPAIAVHAVAMAIAHWRGRVGSWRWGFSVGRNALAGGVAVILLGLRQSIGTQADGPATLRRDLLFVVLAAGAWFVVSHVLSSIAVWLLLGGPWTQMFVRALGGESVATVLLLLLAPVFVIVAQISSWLVLLIGVPLYAAYRYARLSQDQSRAARVDGLTGLANRSTVLARAEDEIRAQRQAAAPSERLAFVLLDLDRFKEVNDALGHTVGDQALVEVGRRLVAGVRGSDVVARLGGDEFAIILPGLQDSQTAMLLAGRIADALSEPIVLEGIPLDLSGSIGVALWPDHGESATTLLRRAEVAMYEAKTQRDAIAVYDPQAERNSVARLGLLGDLRRALELAQVELHYQPQVSVSSGEVIGVEALLRWEHPQRGPVNPEELIRAAEHSTVMSLLTRYVVDAVIAQVVRWQGDGLTLRASVNVSVRDLHGPELVDYLADRLTHYGVSPSLLQLEITESALMADTRLVLPTLRRLEEIGVGLSLDDFGTGYSSLLHLRRLPISEVKIDRSFVKGMAADHEDASIVRSIIDLAAALGLRVVAEGVEDEGAWRRLAGLGCGLAQGWHYAKPMPGDRLIEWLAAYRPRRHLQAVAM